MDTNLGQVVLVQDINPGASNSAYPTAVAEDDSSSPSDLVEFNDRLYFNANNGENGNELYVSDGTDKGTQLVTDLRPGANNYGYAYSSFPFRLVEFNDRLYFTANVAGNGNELFVSDGTESGTQLLLDLYPGEDNYGVNSSYPSNLVELNDKLYFSADDGKNGRELYVSDGTAEGTQLLADINPEENKYGLINNSDPSGFVEFNDQLYFSANDGEHGYELFVSDGTAEGTKLVADIYQGTNGFGFSYGSNPSNLVEFNDQLYFSAEDGENGNELFVSDGTAEGTELLADINPGENTYGSSPSDFVEFNDQLYFSADDGEHGDELFVTDGTAEGTKLLADIYQGTNDSGYSYSSSPSDLVVFNDQLYFTASDGKNGNELYVSNGTAEGTQLFADIYPGSGNYGFPASSFPSNLTVFGDELFFAANNGETGTELYKLTFDSSTVEPQVSITGSDGADNLSGTDNGEEIQALGCQDTVNGGLGNDTIDGGDGDDRLNGNEGIDSLIGGSGNDRLSLTGSLQFADLSFADNNVLLGEEVLATLGGINTEQLTADNFS
jgi:ELWxxDGT repeat protein